MKLMLRDALLLKNGWIGSHMSPDLYRRLTSIFLVHH